METHIQKIKKTSTGQGKFPAAIFLLLLVFATGTHFFRVGWGDTYRAGLFQIMEDDHLSGYCLYWSDPSLFQDDVIRERALIMTAGSIQRWLPVLLGGFPSPIFWSQAWAWLQEIGITAAVFWLAWLASRSVSLSVLSSLISVAAEPGAWNWGLFGVSFQYDHPACAALVLSLAGCATALCKKWKWIPLIAFGASVFHPSLGFWTALFLAGLRLVRGGPFPSTWLVSVFLGPIVVALFQVWIGSGGSTYELMSRSEFQNYCRLNWHLQPWWEPSSGILLARLVNGFLPCFFLVAAAHEDQKKFNIIRPSYIQLVRFLTLASWSGFVLGMLFFYTGIPFLILSSPVRVGAIWAYAALPMLVAYFYYLVTTQRRLDGILCLLALAGLLVWEDNVSLRLPTLFCALFLFLRQKQELFLAPKVLFFGSLATVLLWLIIMLGGLLPAFSPHEVLRKLTLQPTEWFGWNTIMLWLKPSWEEPGKTIFYLSILAGLALTIPGRIPLKVLSLTLLAGLLALGFGVAAFQRKNRLIASEEVEAITKGLANLPCKKTLLLVSDHRSFRFILGRPVALLGFYNNNIYARSHATEERQQRAFTVLGLPYPRWNREIGQITSRIPEAFRRLAPNQQKELMAKFQANAYFQEEPSIASRRNPDKPLRRQEKKYEMIIFEEGPDR